MTRLEQCGDVMGRKCKNCEHQPACRKELRKKLEAWKNRAPAPWDDDDEPNRAA